MTHWKSLMDRKYLFAFDLGGKERTLTIDRVVGGELEGEKGRKTKKPLCYFKESQSGKPLALNATNSKAIAKLYGNEIEEWIGKRITIYPTVTEMNGESVECIRVRPRVPAEKAKAQEFPGWKPPNSVPADAPIDRPDHSDAGDPEPPEPGSNG